MCHCFNPIEGLNCCHPENPFTSSKRICCDCDGKCCERYNEECRDCFWPDFSRPSWLCCRILYGCCPPPDHDDVDPDDEGNHHHKGCGCKG